MALTGIQIFKLLPKTNCRDCGVPTCLAFAMQLAAGKAELAACPHVSEEARKALSEASAPPILTMELGVGDRAFKCGGEIVLFRHEKTFFNPTGIALRISDTEPEDLVDAKLERFLKHRYERVGMTLGGDLLALKADSGDEATYNALVRKAVASTGAPLILWTDRPEMARAGLAERGGAKVLVNGVNAANIEAMLPLIKEHGAVPGLVAESLEQLEELGEKVTKAELKLMVLDSGARTAGALLRDQTAIRRLALHERNRSFGFPTLVPVCDMAEAKEKEAVLAALAVAKYAGIVILSDFDGEVLFPLLLQRLNIFTDPQRPMKSEEGFYPINDPGPESPVLITSNFSLTYFIVSGEIENSRVPTWLFVKDTDGLSVLTAWAAGKFVGDAIGAAIKKAGGNEKLGKKRVIIPGLAAVISGDLEEELGSDWDVLVGPREASAIPAFLKQHFG
ncbi:MAG: acetyl-CoA decarbonylase/synthase complex subunit gamma [Polyangia bacterium]|jgi:acetyl-CoA decarbonylase/synthase complex subunit gamma|nr:acetyl-CoA decarbonylase/synthase complex subunit gamma [Polyangia bacterium]